MELKDKLDKPFTDQQRMGFVVTNEMINKYVIKETEESIEAWDYTQEEKEQQERQRLDNLTLTPSDVERALYYRLGMDFDDLKALIQEQAPTIDMKGLAIEFRANNFYRGAVDKNGNRIVDMIGLLLGYNSNDMDYLFENKELPNKEEE